MPSRDVVLSQPVRTAIGTFNGTLKGTPATELGATVVRETLRRSALDPARVGSVVMGNVIQAGNRMNPARQAAIKGRKGPETFATDEANRPETTLEVLTKLKPAFRKDGTITAGNAPGLNSGAAAMVVADREFAERNRLQPLARLVAYGVAAVEPGLFGIGPVPAVRQALERAHWKLADVERVEINEAFAAVPLAVLRELGLPEDIVNVEGGAIAHGHPIGATGAVLTTRLLHSMRRDGLKRGLVTLCIGGGQGIALALEAI